MLIFIPCLPTLVFSSLKMQSLAEPTRREKKTASIPVRSTPLSITVRTFAPFSLRQARRMLTALEIFLHHPSTSHLIHYLLIFLYMTIIYLLNTHKCSRHLPRLGHMSIYIFLGYLITSEKLGHLSPFLKRIRYVPH